MSTFFVCFLVLFNEDWHDNDTGTDTGTDIDGDWSCFILFSVIYG